jgi:spore maturation protein A
MIIIGVIYAAFTGNMPAVADGALSSAKEAVTLSITMLGVMSLWTGLMEIADKSGLINKCMKLLSPFMKWMFPDVPMEHKAMQHMTTNIIANILGLGWAATPAGIRAMKELANLNNETALDSKQEKKTKKGESILGSIVASDAMCTFLILNISCLQLIPVNLIAYRSQYGSVSPTATIVPGLIATMASATTGIIFCKIMRKRRSKK